MEQKHHTLSRLGLTAALLLLAVLLTLGGSAYARYRTVQERPIAFESGMESTLSVTPGDPIVDGSTWKFPVTVRNGSGEELSFTPITEVSLGILDAQNAEILLVDTTHVIQGDCAAIENGSFLYDSFGPGWYYRFPNLQYKLASGGEITFQIWITPKDSSTVFPVDSKVQTELLIER